MPPRTKARFIEPTLLVRTDMLPIGATWAYELTRNSYAHEHHDLGDWPVLSPVVKLPVLRSCFGPLVHFVGEAFARDKSLNRILECLD